MTFPFLPRARGMARMVLSAVLAVMLVWGAAPAAEAKRLALVVGNADYRAIPSLPNAGNDTRDMAEALRRLDFEVTLLSDVSTDMFWVVLDAFGRQAQGAEAVLFYYAGHAFQIGGVNHLVPVSAGLADPARISAETWSMAEVQARLQGAGGTVLMFLDACRTSPVPGVTADGLAPMDGGKGSFIAFATRPGAVSWDAAGTEGHSPFAGSLLRHIEEPGLGISDLMIRVRNDVDAATDGRQVPWDQSSLRAQFFFRAAASSGAVQVTASAPAPAPAPEPAFVFEVVEDTTIIGPAPVAGAAPAPAAAVPEAVAEAPAVAPAVPAAVPAPVTPEPVAAAVAPPPLPPVQRIEGAQGERLAALADGTRGTAAVRPVVPQAAGAVATAGRPVLAALPSPDDPAAPGDAGAVVALPPAPGPEDLPRVVQEELKRLGCYRLTVDGDWGNGSRNALRRYYDAKKEAVPEELEPTEALWRTLGAEKDGLCPAPPPAPKAASAPKTSGTTTKQAPKAATTQQAPAKKKEPTCRFMVVAIVCS